MNDDEEAAFVLETQRLLKRVNRLLQGHDGEMVTLVLCGLLAHYIANLPIDEQDAAFARYIASVARMIPPIADAT